MCTLHYLKKYWFDVIANQIYTLLERIFTESH